MFMNQISNPEEEKKVLFCPLKEHPNPYFEREQYLSLNGQWEFEINKSSSLPTSYPKNILVPFSVETKMSGINTSVSKDDFMHYRRKVILPSSFIGEALLLNFVAVDQVCDVYWNKELVGHHEGGALPFAFYISKAYAENILEVVVNDDTDSEIYPRGKQSNNPGFIWYPPTSGIYGSVYLEAVPKNNRIVAFSITPSLEEELFNIDLQVEGNLKTAEVEIFFDGLLLTKQQSEKGNEDNGFSFSLSSKDRKGISHLWTPENPNLYSFKAYYGQDKVSSFAGLRKFSVINRNKVNVPAINNKPYFIAAILDQGYFSESGLTAPSYEALRKDILLAKSCGFNCLRKHIKVEPMRFYFMCDQIGMLVGQDFVNGGAPYSQYLTLIRPFFHLPINDRSYKRFGRASEVGRTFFINEIEGTVNLFRNVASLCLYTLFNEGWGQFDARRLTDILRTADNTRLIDSTSGWYDQKAGDFSSHHIYFRPVHLLKSRNRILSLSEFGGYGLFIEGHSFKEGKKKTFGYKDFASREALNEGLSKLWRRDVLKNIKKGLSLIVYTELSDVEQEINGLITYDREVAKVDTNKLKQLNEEAIILFSNFVSKKS